MNSVSSRVRILLLEDNSVDVELVRQKLLKERLICDLTCVDTRARFQAAVSAHPFDLIISDFSLPSFDGFSALQIAQQKAPDVPFIFLSGTMGEELAIEALKRGATDYVLKDRMARLVPSIKRALNERQHRIECRRIEEQLHQKIQEQAALLDKAQDAICLHDLEQRILYWNKGAERLYGWSAAEALGKNGYDLLYQREVPRPDLALKTVVRTGEWQGELAQITRAGKRITVQSRWTLMRDEAGPPASILVINTDVTERKHIEAQFLRTQRLESIGALAGGIAHDLNNVLTPILLATGALRRQIRNPDGMRTLDTVVISVERASEMVKQILSFARGVGDEVRVLDVRHLVNEIVRLAKQTFPRSIKIRAEIPPDTYRVIGNATQLHQVLLNLCVNARDAMPEGGLLRIRAGNIVFHNRPRAMPPEATLGAYVLLSVADTGIGIPAHQRDKIFNPFFTTKAEGKGTGLGLATVREIVKTHLGFIEVSSEPGKGSTFEVYFPATMITDTEFARQKQAAMPTGQGEQILVVDDEAAILAITKATLENFNYRVLTARNGAEGVSVYETHQQDIQLVVTDMMMPVMDGLAMIRALQKLNPRLKIIAISGLSSHTDLVEGAQASVHDLLSKPYTAEQLLNAVRAALDAGKAA